MLMTLALALALQAPAAQPNAADVKTAVEDHLNAACSGLAEADGCGANRTSAEVRGLACRAAGESVAACRYERRTRSAARGQSAWQPAQTNFRYDVETNLWFVDDAAR